MIKRIKLSRTMEIIVNEMDDAFYTGELANLIVNEIQSHGGIITNQDLLDYEMDLQEALSINLNGPLTVYIAYPPSSGIILSLILNILRGFNFHPKDLENLTTAALFYHRLIAAFKFAYAKRTELADPLQTNLTHVCRCLELKRMNF